MSQGDGDRRPRASQRPGDRRNGGKPARSRSPEGRRPGSDRRPSGTSRGQDGGGRDSRADRSNDRRPDRERSTESADEKEHAIPRGPEIADDVDLYELDHEVREELASLPAGARKVVGGHLAMAARLIDSDEVLALEHAVAARDRAGRIGVVREATGIAAYRAGDYALALRELRTVRRLSGSDQHLPLMADCERGLGRPRRALEMASDPAVERLDREGRIEMLIVASGARRDLGEHEAAVVMLQVPELRAEGDEPWLTRLRYAYADALQAAGRDTEAKRWFDSAVEVDLEAPSE